MKSARRNFIKTGTLAAAATTLAGGCTSTRGRAASSCKAKWVDLQVNGRVGISFTDKITEEQVLKVVETLRDGGTAAFLPTIVTCPDEAAVAYIRTIRRAVKKYPECAKRILGIHMEGPFVSGVDGYRGHHRKDCVRDPDPKVYDRWMDASDGTIKIVTIAGERNGAEEFTRHVSASGTIVSIGHSAMYKTADLDRLAAAGAKTFTHLGNALPLQLHRHQNLIWTGLANPHYTPMFIADGYHLPRETLHGYVRACPLDRLITVSDCSYPGGLKPGRYVRNKMVSVLDADGFLHAENSRMLAGSSCLLADCVKVLNSPQVGLSMRDCERLCLENPLKLIGMEGWTA